MEHTNDIVVFIAGTAWLIPLLRAAFNNGPLSGVGDRDE